MSNWRGRTTDKDCSCGNRKYIVGAPLPAKVHRFLMCLRCDNLPEDTDWERRIVMRVP